MQPFHEAVAAFDVEGWLNLHADARTSGVDNLALNPCPICGSTKKKFYVNVGTSERRGRWLAHCCHDQGDIVRLVMAVEGFSDSVEARAYIRYHAGERPWLTAPQAAPQAALALQAAAMALPEPSWPAEPGMRIVHRQQAIPLTERLLDAAAIARYGVRVTGDATTHAGQRRRDLDHRLVFPIHGPDGSLLTWQARDLTGASPKKYVFPSGAAATDTFYGWKAGETGEDGWVLVVEGIFHKLAWDRLGDAFARNTVASFGKKLTESQVRLLTGSRAKLVMLAWDHDAIPQMCQHATRLYGRRRVLFVPPLALDAAGKDRDHDEATPDELLALLAARQEATPALVAQLAAAAALGQFRKPAGSLPLAAHALSTYK
jgi:hypothetical protein